MTTDPLPDEEALARFYSRDYSTDRSERPSQLDVFDSRAVAQATMITRSRHPGRPPGRAEEIGCGVGRLLLELRQRGYQVHGYEPDPVAAEAARQALGDPRAVTTGMADFDHMPPGDLDIVALSHVLEHLPEPVTALSQLLPALGPDGSLFIEVPNSSRRYVRRLIRRRVKGTGHLHFFTPETLSAAVAQAGGTVRELITAGPDLESTAVPFGPADSIGGRLVQLSERVAKRALATLTRRQPIQPFTVEDQRRERRREEPGRYIRVVAASSRPGAARQRPVEG